MKLTILVAGLSILLAASAGAQTKNVSATIKGTLNTPLAGTCPDGYAATCPSGNCQMSTPTADPTISGTFGKGTVTGLCFTADIGNNVNAPADTTGHSELLSVLCLGGDQHHQKRCSDEYQSKPERRPLSSSGVEDKELHRRRFRY
jgi:hypothetical protein